MSIILFKSKSIESCRFVNDALHIRERKKDRFGRAPVERPHGEVIVLPLADSKLPSEVIKGIESVTGMGTDELLRDLRIRRRIIGIITVTAIAVVVLWAGFITAAYVDHVNDVNGYLVVGEAIVTERNVID